MTTRASSLVVISVVLLAGCGGGRGDVPPFGEPQGAVLGATAVEVVLLPVPDSEGMIAERRLVALEGYYAAGSADAPITVIEFSDYQCPFCARAHVELHELKKALIEAGEVRWIFVDFPLPNHPRGRVAAAAARCAGNLYGAPAYWKLQGALFEQQTMWSNWPNDEGGIGRSIDAAGLDKSAILECQRRGGEDETVSRGFQIGRDLGVSGTPTFFVNGIALPGYRSVDEFGRALGEMRAGGAEFLRERGVVVREEL
jgi:protein-disulfide isomerase